MKHSKNHGLALGRILVVLLLGVFLTACAATTDPGAATVAPTVGVSPATPEPTDLDVATLEPEGAMVAYTLRSAAENGRLLFVGVGGEIDGVENPTLEVQAGDTVEVTLIIGDDMMHDVVAPEVGLATDQIRGMENSTTAQFTADTAGSYPYWCSVPGHRAAGMEGLIVVSGG